MISQGQVGPQSSTASIGVGVQPPIRLGNMGDLIVSQLHGGHYESAYRRALFSAANQAATTTTVGLATTYTGLCLSNPVGSGYNVVIEQVGMSFIVAFPAAAALGIMVGYNSGTNVTHTTPVTPRNQFFGVGAAGVALVDAAATLPTAPVVNTVLGAGLTGAITTSVTTGLTNFDLDGSIVLPPGGYAAIYTSTVSGTSGFFGSFLWQEVPQ